MPAGVAEATERLLVASGAASEKAVRWTRSAKAIKIYEWFNWLSIAFVVLLIGGFWLVQRVGRKTAESADDQGDE